MSIGWLFVISGLNLSKEDPRLMMTTSSDQTVKIWSIEDNKPSLIHSKNLKIVSSIKPSVKWSYFELQVDPTDVGLFDKVIMIYRLKKKKKTSEWMFFKCGLNIRGFTMWGTDVHPVATGIVT